VQNRAPFLSRQQLGVATEALLEPPMIELRQRRRPPLMEGTEAAVISEHPANPPHLRIEVRVAECTPAVRHGIMGTVLERRATP